MDHRDEATATAAEVPAQAEEAIGGAPSAPIVYRRPQPYRNESDIVLRHYQMRRAIELPGYVTKKFGLLMQVKRPGDQDQWFIELGNPVTIVRDRTFE